MNDKIREEFEIRAKTMGYDLSKSNGVYLEMHTLKKMCRASKLPFVVQPIRLKLDSISIISWLRAARIRRSSG